MSGVARFLLSSIGLAVGVLGVVALREATLSTHERVDPDGRMALVISARSEGGEHGQSLPEMVEAVLLTCRLEVTTDLASSIEEGRPGRFRVVLAPPLDSTNRRQMRGCLEDWTIDQLRVDVVSFELLVAEPG